MESHEDTKCDFVFSVNTSRECESSSSDLGGKVKRLKSILCKKQFHYTRQAQSSPVDISGLQLWS